MNPTLTSQPLFHPASRNKRIAPFYVMELSKQVRQLEAEGRDIIRLNVGEPDFSAPQPVVRELERAIASGVNGYTDSLGLYSLRTQISEKYYRERFGLDVPPERIVITMGASGALVLACAALVEPNTTVLMSDPCYPCNRNFVTAFDGEPQLVETGPQERFQLTADLVKQHWSSRTRGALITTPSNPTGTSIENEELRKLIGTIRERRGFVIVDEIYQGLTYTGEAYSALEIDSEVVVVNSFSKYFNMPGWRLGWMVAPLRLIPVLERLSQNLFTCAASPLQHAAVACFSDESTAIYETRKKEFHARRDYFVPALRDLGFSIPVTPDGAFYVYADCSSFCEDSSQFANEILQTAGVAIAPGKDFELAKPERFVRFSYANSRENLERAVARIRRAIAFNLIQSEGAGATGI